MSKWYLDCITNAGDISIIYTGVVNWGPVRLHYSSLLVTTDQVVRTSHSVRPQSEPAIDREILRWQSGALGVKGVWEPDTPEVHETIFASGAGTIEWHCLMPRARTRIHNRSGLGYAERLDITIAPWKLPLRTLRWGRFATPSDWIVWIDWIGDFSRRLVYRNGLLTSTSLLEDCRIEFPDGASLTMDDSLVLRQGPIGATALSVIPGVRSTFPARLLEVNECKWRSRARLGRPGSSTVEGWAIHERVEWPECCGK